MKMEIKTKFKVGDIVYTTQYTTKAEQESEYLYRKACCLQKHRLKVGKTTTDKYEKEDEKKRLGVGIIRKVKIYSIGISVHSDKTKIWYYVGLDIYNNCHAYENECFSERSELEKIIALEDEAMTLKIMKTTSRFNVGDVVYFIDETKKSKTIKKSKIKSIKISGDADKWYVVYNLGFKLNVKEEECYGSLVQLAQNTDY